MLNCPQCGADYSEQGLDNGRCRACGMVVQWGATAVPSQTVQWAPPSTDAAEELPSDDPETPPPRSPDAPQAESSADPLASPLHSSAGGSVQATVEVPDAGSDVALEPLQKDGAGGSSERDMPVVKVDSESDTAGSVLETLQLAAGAAGQHGQDPTGGVPGDVQDDSDDGDDQTAATRPSDEMLTLQWDDVAGKTDRQTATIMTESTELEAERRLTIPRRGVRAVGEDEASRADYELIQVIGRGGEGVVHAARQTSIDRTVALKMSHRPTVSDVHSKNKFLSEAVITGALEHPNIVPVYELGTTNDGTAFYAMKRIEGTPWSDVIKKNSLAENLSILMRTADAVAMAHARGVVHRDLKPENVMLGEFGEVMLTDWGIALCTSWFAKRTSVVVSQGLGGTPAYMAPEMATGPVDSIGPAADIYLIGAILYQIVTGKPPHHSTSVLKCLRAASRNEIQPTDIRGELVDIALRAMSTKQSDRYESVKHFQDAIRDYQSHTESVLLADQARRDLKRAAESGEYKDYAAAMVGFQKAVELWPGNREASIELVDSAAAYAAHALKKDDLDLALSLLDPETADHQPLRQRVILARRERDARHRRLRRLRYTALMLLLAIFTGGTYAFLRVAAARRTAETMQRRATTAAAQAEQQAALAEQQRQAAVRSSELAESREMEARSARADAEAAAARATEARKLSDIARLQADAALRRAEVASYGSAISLAAGNIANNAFSDALSVLREQSQRPETAGLRGWEWARLMYLSLGGDPQSPSGPAVHDLLVDSEATGLAVARDRSVLAVSTMGGDLYLWSRDRAPEITPERTTGPSEEADRSSDTPRWGPPVQISEEVVLHDVALSADTRQVATAGSDGVIRVYSVDQPGDPPLELAGHRGPVLSLDFSPQGEATRLASAGADRTVRIWNTQTGKNVRTLVGHASEVWSIAFSPQGDRLVSGSQDYTARVWSAANGAELQRFRQHQEPVFTAAFSPDGAYIASGGYDKRIMVWRADRDEPVYATLIDDVTERLDSDLPPEAVAVDPDVTVLTGHSGGIRDVHFSSDGRFIVSASRDNTLRVWPWTEPSTEGRQLRGHGGWVTSGSFLDDETVVSAAYDGKVKVWDLPRYRPTTSLQQVDRPVLAGTFSPDGRTVVMALDDGTAGLWDRQSGMRLATLDEGHDFLAMKAAFVPGGRRMVTVAGDDTVRCWNVNSGGEIWKRDGAGRRGLLSLSPSGQTLVTGSSDGKAARVIAVESGEVKGVLSPTATDAEGPPTRADDDPQDRDPRPDVTAVAFSPNGRSIATADQLGTVRVYDAETKSLRQTLNGHDGAVSVLQWTPDSETLLSASVDTSIAFWNVAEGQEIAGKRLLHDDAVSLFELSPDGDQAVSVAADRQGNQSLYHWDLSDRLLVQRYPPVPNGAGPSSETAEGSTITAFVINSVAFPTTGSKLDSDSVLVATFDPEKSRYGVQRWDLASGRLIALREQSQRSGMIFSALAAQVASSDRAGPLPDAIDRILTVGGSGARIFDETAGQELMNYRPHGSVLDVDLSPDGTQIATVGSDQSIKIWERGATDQSWRVVQKLLGRHRGRIRTVRFGTNGDSCLLFSAGDDGVIACWHLDERQQWQTAELYRGHEDAVTDLALSPDGNLLASASADETIRLWQLKDNECVAVLRGHQARVLAVSFAADSKRLVSGGEDSRGMVWDLQTGDRITVLAGHSAAVNSVDFSPDGRRVITGSQDNLVKLWNLSPDVLADGDSAKELLSLSEHNREVTAVRFSPDGRALFSAGLDAQAFVRPSIVVQSR